MPSPPLITWFAAAATGAAAGYVLGVFYFRHLQQSTERLAKAGEAPSATLTSTALRVAVALTVFAILMTWSPIAAVVGLVGFTLARQRALANLRDG